MQPRITPQIMVANALYNAQQQTNQLSILQQQASTGNRIQQPSDDPLGELQLLTDQAQNNRLDTYSHNIADAQAKLNSSVSTLNQVSGLLTQAKSLALQGSNSTNSPEAYQALGTQVDSILTEVIQLANTKQNGAYLYGGTASQTQPFTVNAQGQVDYNGSTQSFREPIGQGQQVQTLYDGSQVFQSQNVFQILGTLRDARSATQVIFRRAPQTAAVQQTLDSLDRANTAILNTVGQQSASLQNLQGLTQHLQDVQLQTQQQVSDIQNVDITQVVIGLQEQQNLLQATLYSTSHILNLSLMDFLQ